MKEFISRFTNKLKNLPDKTIRNMIFGVGIITSSIQYLANRSLWLDESMLVVSLLHRDPIGLLSPLEHGQMAPILFIEFEKLFGWLFSYSEYGLRLFTLLVFWATIPLMYSFSFLLFKDRKVTLYSTLLFCLTPSLIYYASEVKQYILDCFSFLLIAILVLREYKTYVRKVILLAIVGSICIFASNITPIVLCSTGLILAYDSLVSKKYSPFLLTIPAGAWLLSFFSYYIFFIHNHPGTPNMLTYWKDYFLPLNPVSADFWLFVLKKSALLFGGTLYHGPLGIFSAFLFFYGIYTLVKIRNWVALAILVLPLIIHFALSAVHQYPVDLRFLLYSVGPTLALISFSIFRLSETLNNRPKWKAFLLLLLPIFLTFVVFRYLPVSQEELRKSIEYVSKHKQPDDKFYVYKRASSTFLYYMETGRGPSENVFFIDNDLAGNLKGSENRKERIWLFYAHLENAQELEALRKALDNIGTRVDSFSKKNSGVELLEVDKTRVNASSR